MPPNAPHFNTLPKYEPRSMFKRKKSNAARSPPGRVCGGSGGGSVARTRHSTAPGGPGAGSNLEGAAQARSSTPQLGWQGILLCHRPRAGLFACRLAGPGAGPLPRRPAVDKAGVAAGACGSRSGPGHGPDHGPSSRAGPWSRTLVTVRGLGVQSWEEAGRGGRSRCKTVTRLSHSETPIYPP